jgi:hypothetical protein
VLGAVVGFWLLAPAAPPAPKPPEDCGALCAGRDARITEDRIRELRPGEGELR